MAAAVDVWTPIIDLTGPAVELRRNGSFLQWRVDGTDDSQPWTNLIELSAIQGLPSPGTVPSDSAVASTIATLGASLTQTALDNRYTSHINVRRFGAKGDGVTDDTAAIQAAIDYAQALVRDAGSPNFNKQKDGATVYLPKGLYKLAATLVVSESNIMLEGESSAATVLYAPNANFDLVKFGNVSYALYNCGVRNLRFSTPGNATAGYHLTLSSVIYFVAENLLFNGWFGGLRIIAGGKIMFRSVIFSQETRNPGTTLTGAAIYLDTHAIYGYPSDIHFNDVQVMENIAYAGYASVIIKGADGVYFSNSHIHGTLLVDPTGTVPVYSLVFNSVYFDGSRDVGVILGGNPVNGYQDIRFNNCYFRDAVVGLRFASARMMKSVTISNCLFAQNDLWAIEMTNSNQQDVNIIGCTFEDNNSTKVASAGDVKIAGNAILMASCTFTGGGETGYGVVVAAGAGYVTLDGLGFVNSSVPYARRILNSGSGTAMRGIVGWAARDRGVNNIPSGVTSYINAHGCLLPPNLQGINLTPGAPCPAFWVTDITATTFKINFASATTQIVPMGYDVNMEN
jgi:hypothetical protein